MDKFTKKYIKLIKEAETDEQLSDTIDKIYTDGFDDGENARLSALTSFKPKKSIRVDNKRLDELMLEKYPHIVYTAEQADEFLKKYEGDLGYLADEDVVAWDFAEYVNKAEKFIIIKTIGKHDNFVDREFDNEESAKSFVSLMRESEQRDFIRYRITKVINY